jgi:hypothetical protein
MSSFRVGLGPASTDADVDALLDALPGVVDDLRAVARLSEDALARFRPPSSG